MEAVIALTIIGMVAIALLAATTLQVRTADKASLLLTLWEVPDQSTAVFMQTFYDRLLVSPNRADAVREAVLELREQYPHPVHWAPFVLMGKVLAGQ